MTEYDYSPDAYERYVATQQRIARWVDNTNRYQQANPFHPSAPEGHYSSPRSTSSSRVSSPPPPSRHTSSRIGSPSEATYYPKPNLSRSQTVSIPVQRTAEHHSQPSSRYTASTSRSGRTRRSSRSNASGRTSHSATTTTTTTTTYKTVHPSKDSPTYIKPSTTQPILVPIDDGRAGYVIVPPKGMRMEVLNPESGYTAYQGYVVPAHHSVQELPEKPGKPLFKRLISSLTSPGGK